MKFKTAIAAIAASLALCLRAGAASILPDIGTVANVLPITGAGTFAYSSGVPGDSGSAQVSFTLDPSPLIRFFGSAGAAPVTAIVIGPLSIPVPVLVTAAGDFIGRTVVAN